MIYYEGISMKKDLILWLVLVIIGVVFVVGMFFVVKFLFGEWVGMMIDKNI